MEQFGMFYGANSLEGLNELVEGTGRTVRDHRLKFLFYSEGIYNKGVMDTFRDLYDWFRN